MNIGVLSVVPSPYQRDLFRALAAHPEVELSVAYLEDIPPDSPWPERSLAAYETVLPGHTFGKGRVRCHTNRQLPDPLQFDAYIVNTALTGLTTQRMFRRLRRHRRWFFWGEILRRNGGIKALLQNYLSKNLRSAKAIVAIGSKARQDYQKRFPDIRVEELPYFCELSEFSEQRPENAIPTFLFCGQMIERKGLDLLLSSFRQLRDTGTDAKLILAGRETDLTPETDEGIEVVGFQAPGDLPQLFARADVFVLPSRHDGWGVVINQAIGAGLPIISTDAVGAAHDLVEPGRNGLLVQSGQVAPLTAAMRQLAEDGPSRRKMAAASAAIAESLDPKIGAQRWVDLLQSECESS